MRTSRNDTFVLQQNLETFFEPIGCYFVIGIDKRDEITR
jgi:hypothetical protein